MFARTKNFWLESILFVILALLFFQVSDLRILLPYSKISTQNHNGLSLRNRDFPNTYISLIHIDLTSPHQLVTLEWKGPNATQQKTGPYNSSPGRGLGYNDCNDPIESNCYGSECTPKGLHDIEEVSDYFDHDAPFQYLVYIDKERAISIHSHAVVPDLPASMGCVRMELQNAKLIHNNTIAGKTLVLVDGTWTKPVSQGVEGATK